MHEIDVTGEEHAFVALLKLANIAVSEHIDDPAVQHLTVQASSLINKVMAANPNCPRNGKPPPLPRGDN